MAEPIVIIALSKSFIPNNRYELNIAEFPENYTLQDVYSILRQSEKFFRTEENYYILKFRDGIFFCRYTQKRGRKGNTPRNFTVYDLLGVLNPVEESDSNEPGKPEESVG